MINILKTSFKIDFAYAINSFIYVLKHLPILKNIISDEAYSSTSLKTIIRILGVVLTSARLILYRLIYFFVIYFLASFVSKDFSMSFLHIYVLRNHVYL